MPFVCAFVCGKKHKKKKPNQRKKKMDFRRADPNFVNFVPRTCFDAVDLFNRHRKLGLTADLYPECFVHCAKSLPNDELDKFHRFIVNPNQDITKGGEKPTLVDKQLEEERLQLVKEAQARDKLALLTIEEDAADAMSMESPAPLAMLPLTRQTALPPSYPEDEDEKTAAASDDFMVISQG